MKKLYILFLSVLCLLNQPAMADPSQEKLLLIIGCGRSGTTFITEFLKLSGLDISHETPLGTDGYVSWPMTAGYVSYLDYKPCPLKFKHVFHQVRHPLAVIASFKTNLANLDYYRSWKYVRKHTPEINETDSLLVHCAKYWYYWNLMAEQQAEWRYRIEDLSDELQEFSERLGIPLDPVLLASMPHNINAWKPINAPVTWSMLKEAIPEDLYENIQEMAKRYGYSIDE